MDSEWRFVGIQHMWPFQFTHLAKLSLIVVWLVVTNLPFNIREGVCRGDVVDDDDPMCAAVIR